MKREKACFWTFQEHKSFWARLKAGDEELFAELQLFTNWRYEDIRNWRKSTSNLVDTFNEKRDDILKARSKIYPFS